MLDLGIKGKKAVICAGSKGLGRGCAEALARAGCEIVLNARGAEALERTAEELRELGASVRIVPADVTSPEGQAMLIAAGEGADILVNNAGGPPPGHWQNWAREDFLAAIEANMLTPISLMQAFVPGMAARGWGRVVNITSQAVKSPLPVLGLSNTARTGLTGFVAGMARQVAGQGVAVNNLLPGLHDTDRATSLDEGVSAAQGVSVAEARAAREATIPAGRYGTVAEFGAACAFLCSQHAGFIIGQNILADGGAFNSTM